MDVEDEEAGLKFQSTEKLREFLRKVAATTTVSEKFRNASLKYAVSESVVPFAFLREVYEELRPGDRSPIHQVLAGSSFFLESPKPREKSEELKARLKKLQEMVDQKQYDELVHDITKHTEEPEYFSTYKDQLGFGLHVALTMFTGFFFGYTVFRSQFRETPVLHAAGGALGLIIGMLVETLLFIVRDVQREKMEAATKIEVVTDTGNTLCLLHTHRGFLTGKRDGSLVEYIGFDLYKVKIAEKEKQNP